MDTQRTLPTFSVISGASVHAVVDGRHKEVMDLVEQTYRLHGSGRTTNPPSYFLRFPDRPGDRIIALPAALGGEEPVSGLKWISSFPGNLDTGIPRASAVLVLNDAATGYPFACLESSIISAARTAASAAVAARCLIRSGKPLRVGFIGVGLIARYIHEYLAASELEFAGIGVYDLERPYAEARAAQLRAIHSEVTVHDTAEQLIRGSDLVVLATTAGSPTSAIPRGSSTIRRSSTCRCGTWIRPSFSVASTSSTTSSTYCRPTPRSIWPNSAPGTALFCTGPSTTY